MRATVALFVAWVLLFSISLPKTLQAERATQEEMAQVCQNWLAYIVHQTGGWGGDAHPKIAAVREIQEEGVVLGCCFSISPQGFVAVPVLKELPPVKAYSETCNLDVQEDAGLPLLLREALLHRINLFIQAYGSVEARQPSRGNELFDSKYRKEWDCFLASQDVFLSNLQRGTLGPLTQAGPLLTTLWHQEEPYNNFCPMGDGGRCIVGCVATAAAQVMRYHEWPPSGKGERTYLWGGDQSCGGDTDGGYLYADFSDPYDWANMPGECTAGCTQEEEDALAELCYEMGVAFSMNYGHCASGAFMDRVLLNLPKHFFYEITIDQESRSAHTADSWFSLIQDEINAGRPLMYSYVGVVYGHALVCDGWRDTGGLNQYHMNYGGWPDMSYTGWYTVDNMADSVDPMRETLIRNIMPHEGTLSITSVSPSQGATSGGTRVTIYGTDFTTSSDTHVSFGGTWAKNIQVISSTELTCTAAAHPPGLVNVRVVTVYDSVSLPNAFEYLDIPPEIASIEPNYGDLGGGTLVTVNGNFFSPDTIVYFGAQPAGDVIVQGYAVIVCISPPGDEPGAVDVKVSNSLGFDILPNGFTYDYYPPEIYSLTPDSGSTSGGVEVTIYGANFTSSEDTYVAFWYLFAPNVHVINTTTLTCTAPGLPSGTYDVAVVNSNGSDCLENAFTYLDTPIVYGISPDYGPIAGGSKVTVLGANFTASGETAVTFGLEAAGNVVVLDSTTMTCSTPPHAVGPVSVAVTNGFGYGERPDAFTYLDRPCLYLLGGNPTPGQSVAFRVESPHRPGQGVVLAANNNLGYTWFGEPYNFGLDLELDGIRTLYNSITGSNRKMNGEGKLTLIVKYPVLGGPTDRFQIIVGTLSPPDLESSNSLDF